MDNQQPPPGYPTYQSIPNQQNYGVIPNYNLASGVPQQVHVNPAFRSGLPQILQKLPPSKMRISANGPQTQPNSQVQQIRVLSTQTNNSQSKERSNSKNNNSSQSTPSKRPPNCRIFIGNLASEKTSREELLQVFSKYGNIIEDIVMRKSFGFIQYDNPQSAQAAILGENGRVIGSMKIDINLADNRSPHERKIAMGKMNRNRDNSKGRRNRSRSRSRSPRRRKRSNSPNNRYDRNKRQAITSYPNPILCQILFIGRQSEGYAHQIEDRISNEGRGLGIESIGVEYKAVPDKVRDSESRGIRYAIVVGRHSEQKGTLTLHIFRPNTRSENHNDIPIDHAIDIIRNEEDSIAATYNRIPNIGVNVLNPLLNTLGIMQNHNPMLSNPASVQGPSAYINPNAFHLLQQQGGYQNFPQTMLNPNMAQNVSQSNVPLSQQSPSSGIQHSNQVGQVGQVSQQSSLVGNAALLQSLLANLTHNTSQITANVAQQDTTSPSQHSQSQFQNTSSHQTSLNLANLLSATQSMLPSTSSPNYLPQNQNYNEVQSAHNNGLPSVLQSLGLSMSSTNSSGQHDNYQSNSYYDSTYQNRQQSQDNKNPRYYQNSDYIP